MSDSDQATPGALPAIVANPIELARAAADKAARAQLAFSTGNFGAYLDEVFGDAKARLDAAYDELNGPRATSEETPTDDNEREPRAES